MFERFTGESRQVVVLSQELARKLGHGHIGTEHLLLGLLAQDGSPVRNALAGIGLTYDAAEAAVRERVPPSSRPPSGHMPFTPRAKKSLELSLRATLRRGDVDIRPQHLLLGILDEGEGVAAQLLVQDGRTVGQINEAVTATMGPGGGGAVPYGRRTPAAEQVLAMAERLAAGAPVGSHHLLEALAAIDSGIAGRALAGLGITGDALVAQIDVIDLRETADATPEMTAAATVSLTADADTVTLTSADPGLVEKVRRLVEQTGGPLTGNGVLAGPFIGLHGALTGVVSAIDATLNPPPAEPGEAGPPSGLLKRLRRLRPDG